MIEARGIHKMYQNGQKEIRPLDGIDFTCEKGEFVLVTGRSGSGKTTFLNVLGGLTLPHRRFGEDCRERSPGPYRQ